MTDKHNTKVKKKVILTLNSLSNFQSYEKCSLLYFYKL
jgi:hypothetical protein